MEKITVRTGYIIIAILSFAIYFNTLQNDFVFDDESVVQNYQAIRDLSNIPKYFTGQEGFHKVIGRYYRPVVSTTYTLDYAIWSLKPSGFHLTNNLIHLFASVFLFSILVKLFEKYKYGILSALIGTLIFAAHPIHTEAVSWISGRTDSIVTLFFFISFYFYLIYSEKKSSAKLYLSLLFYFLGLLSKEMIVTLPIIIIFFDFIYKKKTIKELFAGWKPYLYFGAVTIIYFAVRYLVLKDVTERTTYQYFYEKGTITVFATMLKTIPVYFKLLFYPVNLLYHYNGWIPDSNSLIDFNVIIAILYVVILSIAIVILYKKYSKIAFSILFFFITLLPVMNIIPTMNFMAERFLYMTSFALSLVITSLLAKYFSKDNSKILVSISMVIVIIFSILTFQRNKDWKDNDTLYKTGEGINGSVLLVNCGNIYANKQQYDEAEKRFRKAIEIRDNSVLAHHNLGLIYLLRGNLDSAEIQIKKGLQIDSLAPDGYFQLSNIYQQQGKISDAINMLEKLQIIIPDYRSTKSLLDKLKSGDINNLQNMQVNPQNANQISILEKRSYQFYNDGKFNEAIKDIDEMIKLKPEGKSGYLNNMALCYQGLNKSEKAKECFEEALISDDKNINALNGIASYYLQKNNRNKAKEYIERIIKINPNDAYALRKLDSLKKL